MPTNPPTAGALRALDPKQPHLQDWEISGPRGLAVYGHDPRLYPANERVCVAQVNPTGEGSPESDQDWALLIATAPDLLTENERLRSGLAALVEAANAGLERLEYLEEKTGYVTAATCREICAALASVRKETT